MDNLKNIKINYNIKAQDSFNNSLLSNNKHFVNQNFMNNFKNFMNNFDKLNSNSQTTYINFQLGEVNNFSNGIYNRNELRRTKNSFFSRKKISNSTKKEEKHLNRNNSAKNIKSLNYIYLTKIIRII